MQYDRKTCILLIGLLVFPFPSIAETIYVQWGIDDGIKTTLEQDYKEAVLSAKHQIIKRAGVETEEIQTVKDLFINSDYIESEAEAVLMPGYKIENIGYQKDGTYLVILVGKIKTAAEEIDSKELRYAKSLVDRDKRAEARKIVDNIIKDSKKGAIIAEALYYKVLWEFASDETDTYEKLKAYYPNSKYVGLMEAVLAGRKIKEEKRREEETKQFEANYGMEIGRDGRFIAFSKGIVLDTKTNLEWLAGPDKDTTWNQAKTWVERQLRGDESCRMPTTEELKTLYQKGAGTRNMTPLLKTTGWWIWSVANKGSDALYFNYFEGSQGWDRMDTSQYLRAFSVCSGNNP